MERLFDDYAVSAFAYQHGRHVLIRCPRNSFMIVQEFWAADETEWLGPLGLSQTPQTRAFVPIQGLPETVPVLLIKVTLEMGETEVLLTTRCDRRRYPTQEFKLLYAWRWHEEPFFDRVKNIFEVERFSGFRKPRLNRTSSAYSFWRRWKAC